MMMAPASEEEQQHDGARLASRPGAQRRQQLEVPIAHPSLPVSSLKAQ